MSISYTCDLCKRDDASAGWESNFDGLVLKTINVCEKCRKSIRKFIVGMYDAEGPAAK